MYGREYVLNAAIAAKVDVSRVDVYGRTPLHYASMNGRVDALQTLVAAGPRIIDTMDHDNFTPLILAIVHHQLPCVQRLLSFRARVDPSSESDHIPLNLACQHGSVPIVELLLQNHAAVLPDAEGLYPQHLVARSGKSPELLLMLREYGADLDQLDKLYQWTPLFHAASEGHLRSLQVLLECGVRPDINDEKGLSAVYYAAWEGHLQCMRLLAAAGVKAGLAKSATPLSQASTAPAVPASSTPAPMAMEHDAIPDLSLPPPIIPLRRYGHNFLDSKTFVAISFEEAGAHAIRFFHDSKYPAARLTITSKLSDLIPRNVLIPIQEDSRVISFQIDNLDLFTVDFDIFPTFGSKVIARSIALPNNFNSQLSSTGHCCLPLFDPRLRAIGQISFNYQVIKPFHGIPLEITDFATYWKATSQRDEQPSAFITGSSLSGEYVRLFVQLTNDGVPVLCPQWTVNLGGIEFSVGRLTYEQFVSIGAQRDQGDENLAALANWETQGDITKIHQVLATSFASLKDALAVMPPNLHVELHVLFPSATEEHLSGLGPTPNINDFADAILSDVFDHARQMRERSPDALRSIVFTSFNSNICAALNWKQPNYPVLLCNNLGSDPASLVGNTATVQSSGQHSISVKEAVRIAQGNNFMGLVCCSRLLVCSSDSQLHMGVFLF
ncbi:ankyrin [Xylona heveae TC161]|uniref:Ankyrin n=1 Tax=Xylona heveae (strain CBS 132557 / TC161) TaxID=1328760 RepID=A0A165IX70_XYLHT|nr:ankyrin [Xylona heveae TC161]KZF25499.1 ankyrin [Xylona heveae TC161]